MRNGNSTIYNVSDPVVCRHDSFDRIAAFYGLHNGLFPQFIIGVLILKLSKSTLGTQIRYDRG